MVLLDTDVVVAHLRGDATVSEKIAREMTDLCLPAIVVAELEYGARISANRENNLKLLNDFLRTVTVVPFDRASASKYGDIKTRLKSSGSIPGEVDILIAAIAMAQEALLVTHNTKHLGRIAGLRLADWL
ncbi:MAG: type II toxin-antitoxin system VapC family toxin [Chloroflexi bacterium]|nr:type II toxin-antitoxin system VapC family toxin [Chloroflexota bacterium]